MSASEDKWLDKYKKLKAENSERIKELSAIYRVTEIIDQKRSVNSTLKAISQLLPSAWQYPDYTVCRIIFDDRNYDSVGFIDTKWKLSNKFSDALGRKGSVNIHYTRKFDDRDEGPFLFEERQLINVLSIMIGDYISKTVAEEKAQNRRLLDDNTYAYTNIDADGEDLLQRFLNKQNSQRDIYHDLMPFKVREILLVSTLYDAYNIDRERRASDHILGEYHKLNLTSMPRITGVSGLREAQKILRTKRIDLIIVMIGVAPNLHIGICSVLKREFPYIPLFLLLNNDRMAAKLENTEITVDESIDRVFVWNGDTRIFFAMVKYLEDKVNVENDTRVGLVRVIILVEDSSIYYSKYLPLLYNILLGQIKEIIEEVNTDDLYKVLRMRARPKILLAENYEEAYKMFHHYRSNILCLITDMSYNKNNINDHKAGEALIRHVRTYIKDLPVIVQSTDDISEELIEELNVIFLNKHSKKFKKQVHRFLKDYLGFGNFVFRDSLGEELQQASSLQEFEKLLYTVPDESLDFHGRRNHFSSWLMARGEIELAKMLLPYKVSDFSGKQELRELLIYFVQNFRNTRKKGQIIPFSTENLYDVRNVFTMSGGLLGGKGRGIAFVSTLVYNLDFIDLVKDISIKTPITCIIGTDEFSEFIDSNNILIDVYEETDYEVIRERFINGKLSESLRRKLLVWLAFSKVPLAVRSSGLLEDSMLQPFAGVYSTYMLPNNNEDITERYKQLENAIKMVYASVFSPEARAYIESVKYKLEDERMAIVIQEVVGGKHGNYFYPNLSGAAQSYNYYPFGAMKPDDGLAEIALGLGKYVVEGNMSYRFSPNHPSLDIYSTKDIIKNSQTYFWAINMVSNKIDIQKGEDATLAKRDLYDAEKDGTIKHLASVYNVNNDTIMPGLDSSGPRVLNFANILKYNYIPLADTIKKVLDIIGKAFGSPVGIEFAVDLNKDSKGRASFYLLQIKPMIGEVSGCTITDTERENKSRIVYSTRSMGNGVIDCIKHIVIVDRSTFDKTETVNIANQIEEINSYCKDNDIEYVLIGPGRWGTRDKWIGIPVTWSQISKVKAIIETSLKDFPLDASSGSHFFHNVTSMNIGYASVNHDDTNMLLDWNRILSEQVIFSTKHVRLIEFKQHLTIKMDGIEREMIILL